MKNLMHILAAMVIVALFVAEGFVSGVVKEKSIYKNVCVYISVGLKVQKGDRDMMDRAYDENKNRMSMAEQEAENTAKKVYKTLKVLKKEQKIGKYLGKLPKNYEYYRPGTSGYSKYKFPEKVDESNADEYLGKKAIYSFRKNDAEILISFKKLPEKDIRETIKNKVLKDLSTQVEDDNECSNCYEE